MLRSFRASLPLILVIMTAGCDGQDYWGVNYSPSYVCALQGSKVEISCTVKYPYYRKLEKIFWTKYTDKEPLNLCLDHKKPKRVRCASKYKDNKYKDTSSITLTAVTEADKHIYYCRFTTDAEDGKWTGIPGVQLDVTDLQVETQQIAVEGDSVTLRCKSSCSLPEETTFIWYRNGKTFNEGITTLNNQLHLQSVRGSDAGYYQCGVEGNEHLKSPAVYVKVGAVDGLRDSGVIYSSSSVCALKGSTVKISCTSTQANYYLMKFVTTKPAVTDKEPPDLCTDPDNRGGIHCVSEYKDREYRDTYSITLTAVTEADKHIYYCRFTDRQNNRWTVIPGARLDVTDLQVETQQTVVEGDSVTLSCKSSCSLPEETTFIWYRNTERLTGETLNNQLQLQSASHSDAGEYRCAVRGKAGNELLKSPPVHLKVGPINSLQYWGVKYSSSSVCALKGSTVTMSCTSTRAGNYKLTPAFWTKTIRTDEETQSLCSDPDKTERVQCDIKDKDTSSITLTAVTEADKHKYYCSCTDKWNKRWTVVPGVWLDVTDLQVETQQTVVEGDSVTLSCKSSCSLPEETTFIWYRNTERLPGETLNNQLQLQSVSHSDAGEYRCAVRGKIEEEHLKSPAVHLSVEYKPKSVSVSVSGSAVIVSGDSVTLSCISDSNPPAVNFTWLKEEASVGSGRIFSISNISSDHSGEYKCRARNEHGEKNSDPVTLNVMYPPRSVSVSVSGSAVIMEGHSVTLSCSSDSNPPAEISFYKGESSVGSGKIYTITNITSEASGNYSCSAKNKHGSQKSAAVTVSVMYPPRTVSAFISGSAVIVSGDSVTLSCNSDSNPPAVNFTWFKEGQSSAVGSGQSFSISSFNSSHSGRYYCEAENKYGSQRSESVSVTEGVQRSALLTLTGVVAGCGGLIIIIIIIVFIWKKKRDGGAEDTRQNQNPIGRSAETASTNDSAVYSLVSANQSEDLYAKVTAKKPKRSSRAEAGDVEDLQYASVHHFKNKDMKTEEHQKMEMQRPSDANRCEDVIYSSVK